MGVCRPRRARSPSLRLGRRIPARRQTMTNSWQGRFPYQNTGEDGYAATAPVGYVRTQWIRPVRHGRQRVGMVRDWYRPEYYKYSPYENPTGPPDSYDPLEPGIPKKVQRGGSFMCTDQYCTRYVPGGRGKGAVDSGEPHLGFRCVSSPTPSERELGCKSLKARPQGRPLNGLDLKPGPSTWCCRASYHAGNALSRIRRGSAWPGFARSGGETAQTLGVVWTHALHV